jgi:hypothetical protein
LKSKYRLFEVWHERTDLNSSNSEYYEYIMFFDELVPIPPPPRAMGLAKFRHIAAKSPNCKILVTLRKTNEPYFK